MRTVFDIVGQVLGILWAHKLRSFLTMFGIAWGVGSLLFLIGVGEGFRSGQQRNLANIGEDIIFIWGGQIPAVEGQSLGKRAYNMTYKDYADIKTEASAVRDVSPVLARGDIKAQSDFATTSGTVSGAKPNFNQIRYLPQGEGRWLNEADEDQRRQVAVLGFQMMRNLFPGRPAIGSTILLNGVRFEVVGVLSNIGRQENNLQNVRVYIPFTTMKMYFPLRNAHTPDDVNNLVLRPVSRDAHEIAVEQVHKVIARNHGFDWQNQDAFQGWDTVKSQDTIGKIFTGMDLFLGGVGMVTLLLGAMGIVNIMLVSVTERTHEIGLMKALGATNRRILVQFFLEGAFLTAVSGGVGIGLASGVMNLLGKLPTPPGIDTPHIVPASAALAVITLSIAGIVAALYPARKAALLQPVEALRRE
ncbi:MAG TPA: ABC transporter permease [Candidatus Sulfotelmatobacter sp.]|nr:ABC transporter permease [Candidatus Sulfotelmatobacter sp.]